MNLSSATDVEPGSTRDVTFEVSNTGSVPGALTSTMLVTDVT